MSATTLPVQCTWATTPDFDPDQRTIQHLMHCPACCETWPAIARQMRIARGAQVPSDDPGWLGANVGYKDK